MLDYIRIACAVPEVQVANVEKNTRDICAYMAQADAQNVDILLFPELAITGYSCGDLFLQDALHDAVEEGLGKILECSAAHPRLTAVVGLPIRAGHRLFNCAAVVSGGKLENLAAKTYLADYGESSESRWFSDEAGSITVELYDNYHYIDARNVLNIGGALVGIEICEDLFAPFPPSSNLVLNGAEVILNLAASPETAGKRRIRKERVVSQSALCKCIYAFASAGYTESTSDLVFSGHSIIAENGVLLKENSCLTDAGYMMIQDCDLGKVRAERRRNTTFRRAGEMYPVAAAADHFVTDAPLRSDGTLYPLQKLPFIPSTAAERKAYCLDVFQLQVTGLKQRLKTINANAVIGISGGLDSTLALLVAVEAMRQLDKPLTNVYGVTMPCFGTSDRTYNNSWDLMKKLGIDAKEISIKDAVTLHFKDIGHDASVHNGTYENSQARERTQILMDYASTVNGIVVGTGDLSELALGWCTYNGDHMSMYGVNGTIPKTLIRWIIEAVAELPAFAQAKEVLIDILDTPISPELLPPDAEGKISQQTEDLVGPYALHDFFLYHILRYGFTPTKIYTMACRAFADDFAPEVIKKWLRTFYWRFFTQQFKRNCMPDGAKAGPLGLGPRGDWKMPSDASGRIWIAEIEKL
ncbi:MAG: NAD(+) synthase [Oscillospiraceae bacterium]|nr:NAD(+) synthase [Oscillospiraceae bacterium]